MESASIVMPGDVLATEEEYIPGMNAHVENGHIYAAVEGTVSVEGGVISVRNPKKNVTPIKEGMYVIGLITDDIRTVQFVKLDDIVVGDKRFVAVKNGKIVAKRRSEGMSSRQPLKEFAAGDVVLARVDSDREDTYELDTFGRELGVVNANCSLCGRPLRYMENDGKLRCDACKRSEYRHTSAYYGDIEKIAEEIKQHALSPVKRQRPSRPPFRRTGGFHDSPRGRFEEGREGHRSFRPRFEGAGDRRRETRNPGERREKRGEFE